MSEFHQSSPGDHLLRDHLLTPPAQNQPLEADPKPVTTETVPSMSGDARESSERQYDGDFENQQLTCEFCDKVFSVRIPDTIRTSGFVNFKTIDPNLRAKLEIFQFQAVMPGERYWVGVHFIHGWKTNIAYKNMKFDLIT